MLVSNTAFYEHLTVEDTIICMVIFDVNITVFSESLEFMFHLCNLFTTGASLNKAKYAVRSIIYDQSTTNCMVFGQNLSIIITYDARFS